MGRTLPTSRMLLQRLAAEWSFFAEVVTLEEQRLDAWLWQAAERHASAIGHVARASPMEAVHHAMLLEVLKELRRVDARLARVEGTGER